MWGCGIQCFVIVEMSQHMPRRSDGEEPECVVENKTWTRLPVLGLQSECEFEHPRSATRQL